MLSKTPGSFGSMLALLAVCIMLPATAAAAQYPTAMVGGQVQLMFGTTVALLPQVRAGKLRAIAVTTAKRSAAAPDVPTIAESGV